MVVPKFPSLELSEFGSWKLLDRRAALAQFSSPSRVDRGHGCPLEGVRRVIRPRLSLWPRLVRAVGVRAEIAAIRVGLVGPISDLSTWKVTKLRSSGKLVTESCEVLRYAVSAGFVSRSHGGTSTRSVSHASSGGAVAAISDRTGSVLVRLLCGGGGIHQAKPTSERVGVRTSGGGIRILHRYPAVRQHGWGQHTDPPAWSVVTSGDKGGEIPGGQRCGRLDGAGGSRYALRFLRCSVPRTVKFAASWAPSSTAAACQVSFCDEQFIDFPGHWPGVQRTRCVVLVSAWCTRVVVHMGLSWFPYVCFPGPPSLNPVHEPELRTGEPDRYERFRDSDRSPVRMRAVQRQDGASS